VVPAAAQVSEADVLVGEAILAYDGKRYDEALRLLQEALKIDPDHVEALYYTGLAYLALRQPALAAEVLEKARAKDPKDPNIRLQLGVAYFSQERYEQAEPLLSQLFSEQPRLPNLGYYVGFMRYRRKDYQGALEAFRAGVSPDPDIQQLTRFYSGLALGFLGLPDRASAEIGEALRLQPASPITGAAERLRESVVVPRACDAPYHLEVRMGGTYDDNVPVIPNNSPDPVVQILRNQIHRSYGWLSSVQGAYCVEPARQLKLAPEHPLSPLSLTASYSFFTTQNTDFHAFNIMDHVGGLGAAYGGGLETPLGVFRYQAGLQYTYDYLTLGGDEFVARHSVIPFLSLPDKGTILLFRYQHKRYALSSNPIQAEKLDGSNYMVGFLQYVPLAWFAGTASAPGATPSALSQFLSSIIVMGGYQADWDLIQGADYTYFGSRILAGVQYTFPWAKPFANLRFNYNFDVHFRSYRNFNVIFPTLRPNTFARYDTEYVHNPWLEYPIIERRTKTCNLDVLCGEKGGKIPGDLLVRAEFLADIVRSNLDVFTYNRNVATLLLVWLY
jgi:tetratricopeptide (TPR) repeat protein